MAQNIEIKIPVDDLAPLRKCASRVANRGPFKLQQVDYFFPVPNGRLKLRVQESDFENGERKAELIAYHRSDAAEARASDYLLCPTNEPDLLRESLTRSLGIGPVVRKQRELYLIGRTRIHLDQVEGLGSFLEIEVVMNESESAAVGHSELRSLLDELGVSENDASSVAYADMLATAGKS